MSKNLEKRKTEVKTYYVEITCPKCNEGDLVFSGMTLASSPPWYVHNCTNCDHRENLRKSYPTTEIERVQK